VKYDKREESFLLVEKNRDGEKKAVPVYFNRETVTFLKRVQNNYA